MYYMRLNYCSYTYLLLYVNNMLIATKHLFDMNELKRQLSSEFEMKDLGEAKKILVWISKGTGLQ